jgi:hypothetical protein
MRHVLAQLRLAEQRASGAVETHHASRGGNHKERIGQAVEHPSGFSGKLVHAFRPCLQDAVDGVRDTVNGIAEHRITRRCGRTARFIGLVGDPASQTIQITRRKPEREGGRNRKHSEARQSNGHGKSARPCQKDKHRGLHRHQGQGPAQTRPCGDGSHPGLSRTGRAVLHGQDPTSTAARAAMLTRSFTVAPRRTICTGFSRPTRIGPMTCAPPIASTSL